MLHILKHDTLHVHARVRAAVLDRGVVELGDLDPIGPALERVPRRIKFPHPADAPRVAISIFGLRVIRRRLRRRPRAEVRARVAELLELTGLTGYGDRLPGTLSGGERQRLTIARLLLKQPQVVILDEATASLDSTSEAAVQAALGEALAGRTALVIAHRLSTIRAADLIAVVEDGRIVERGTHAALLAAGGRYEELYRTQFAEDAPVADLRGDLPADRVS